jgi:hypothetical protein
MAEVKLNGKNLGIVWCPPWQVEIPQGLLLEKGNKLEIKVANLWENRLRGDVGLPPQKQIADFGGSSIRFQKDQGSLFPSGLLGPVRILSKP